MYQQQNDTTATWPGKCFIGFWHLFIRSNFGKKRFVVTVGTHADITYNIPFTFTYLDLTSQVNWTEIYLLFKREIQEFFRK